VSTYTPDPSSVSPRSIVIAAGGTGGHIYPGLALADAVQRLAPDARISFVGTSRGLEGRLVPAAGHTLHLVDMIPFARNVGARRYLLPVYAMRAAFQARRILRREGADVAVGMGGYASIPLIAGARLARVPSLIHESGAVAGRANRVAARLTRNVATAFDMPVGQFPARVTTRTVGMPLAPELAGFDREALRAEARAAFALAPEVVMLLVNGGSQGSARLNDAALGLARRWRDRDDVHIVLKAGRANVDDVERRLKELGGERVATCVAYLERMDHAYAAADLALCRAGAGTVAELAIAHLPAVLVPYPFAPDDHQAANARALVDAGAALLVRDGDATSEQLAPQIEQLLADRDRLAQMAGAAAQAAHPHAAEALAAWALELAQRAGR
jgi:UDP-N-acetylglucosamine--N-acetylmuramyl-(pentapeptide) pyrophosphoryl-undecaprenol N-acetylglucosamine transferase